MGKSTSYEIEKGLFLVEQTVDTGAKPKAVETSTNHVAVIDCSGSMTGDLPRIREQLKKKLPKLLKDGDTLSLLWFSGRSECGIILEEEPVATLVDLNAVNKAIDRWLRPIGLTGFKEPLQEVEKLVARVGKKNKNPFALFFMSDGCDNQWNRADILKVVEQTAGGLASSTFVEYGYYADRPLLAAMAEKAGGTLIFAEAFDKYEPMFEAAMQKRPLGGKRIEIGVVGDVIGGFAWTMVDGDITTFDASTSKVHVPEQTAQVYYLSPVKVGVSGPTIPHMAATTFAARKTAEAVNDGGVLAAAYAAMSLFAVRMKPEIVYPILKATGDVTFIDAFSICFGKQKYSEFMDAAKLAAFDEKLRFMQGRDPNKVPADDAFTVLDLLKVLSDDDSTRLLLDHPTFKYSRVSRGRVDADENLTADEQLSIEVVRQKMAGEKSAKKLKELQAEIDKILSSKKDALKFVADPAPDGYEISNLTYNECRPNISVLIKKTGHVDLSERLAKAPVAVLTGAIEKDFKTHIFRNYTIVCDGLVNVEKLPVKLSDAVAKKLNDNGVEMEWGGDGITVINVKPLPIINRKMVKAVSAKTIIELEWELLQKRAAQKVYKHFQGEMFPTVKLRGFFDLYGAEGTEWLKEQGITPGGFSPKMVQAESIDFIMGKELEIKLKGCSTLASIKAVKEKITGGKKLNPCDTFMSEVMDEVEAFVKKNPTNLHEKWLVGKANSTIAETRGLIYQTSQIKFGILVGQVWFQEFKSLDENQLTVKIGKQDVVGTCEMREIQIKI